MRDDARAIRVGRGDPPQCRVARRVARRSRTRCASRGIVAVGDDQRDFDAVRSSTAGSARRRCDRRTHAGHRHALGQAKTDRSAGSSHVGRARLRPRVRSESRSSTRGSRSAAARAPAGRCGRRIRREAQAEQHHADQEELQDVAVPRSSQAFDDRRRSVALRDHRRRTRRARPRRRQHAAEREELQRHQREPGHQVEVEADQAVERVLGLAGVRAPRARPRSRRGCARRCRRAPGYRC